MEGVVKGDFRMGPWLVEPGLNTVSHRGTSLRLEPKVMGVLVCLARHPGEPYSKEHSVPQDAAKTPHFVQTTPTRCRVTPVVLLNGAPKALTGLDATSKPPAVFDWLYILPQEERDYRLQLQHLMHRLGLPQ